jgi:hypothetical protein
VVFFLGVDGLRGLAPTCKKCLNWSHIAQWEMRLVGKFSGKGGNMEVGVKEVKGHEMIFSDV